jgi:hypothetical protein
MLERLFFWRKHLSNQEIVNMELLLQSSLKPVTPRPGFVEGLRNGLMNYSYLTAEPGEKEMPRNIIIVIAGFFSAVFVLLVGVGIIAKIANDRERNPHPRLQLGKKRMASAMPPSA